MKRDTDTLQKDEYRIVDCRVIVTWSDGVVEDLSPDLPEYLSEEIETYLDELDDLRSCDPDDYNFSEIERH